MYGGQSTNASFGGSTIDWGFLGAISGRKNFDALKQEKLREVALVQQQNAILENRIAKQEAAQQGVSEYLDTINNLKVLPQGLERIKEVDKSLRENVTQGLMDAKGDVRKWLMSGGTKVLNEYKKNLVNNEVTQREIGNAYQTNRWLADKQAGLQEEYNFDEKGQPYGFEQQYQKYKNGEIDSLNYSGAFKLPEYKSTIPERYAFTDKEKGKSADPTDLYNDAYMQFKDLPEKQRRQAAWHKAMEYTQALQSGAAAYEFKHDQRDPLKDALMKSQTAKNYSGIAKDKAEIGAIRAQQTSFLDAFNRGIIQPTNTENITDRTGKVVAQIPYLQADNKTYGIWSDLSGIAFKDGIATEAGLKAVKNMELYSLDGKKIDLSRTGEGGILKAENADSRIYYMPNDNRPYIKVNIHLSEKQGTEKAIYDGKIMEGEKWLQSIDNLPPGSDYKDDKFFSFDDKRGVVPTFVPLNTTPMSLQSEKQEMGYFPKNQDNFAGENIGVDLMQGLDNIFNNGQ